MQVHIKNWGLQQCMLRGDNGLAISIIYKSKSGIALHVQEIMHAWAAMREKRTSNSERVLSRCARSMYYWTLSSSIVYASADDSYFAIVQQNSKIWLSKSYLDEQ